MADSLLRSPPPIKTPTITTQADLDIDGCQSRAMLPAYANVVAGLTDLPVYDIDLEIDVDSGQYSGTMTITYTNTEGVPLESLYFRLFPNGGKSYGNGSLHIEDVTGKGRIEKRHYSLHDSVLELLLDTPIGPGERIDVDFSFSGQVPVDLDGAGYGIYNLTRGVMAMANWYPMLAVYDEEGWNLDPVSGIGDSVYSDSAYYKVRVRAPEEMILVTTGSEIRRQKLDNHWKEINYVSGPTRDFMIILSANFEQIEKDVHGTLVRSSFLTGHEQGAEVALDISFTSMDIFNQK